MLVIHICEQFNKKLSLQEHKEHCTALHTHTQLQVVEWKATRPIRDSVHYQQAQSAKPLRPNVWFSNVIAGDQTTDSTSQFSLTPLPANSLTVGVFRNAT